MRQTCLGHHEGRTECRSWWIQLLSNNQSEISTALCQPIRNYLWAIHQDNPSGNLCAFKILLRLLIINQSVYHCLISFSVTIESMWEKIFLVINEKYLYQPTICLRYQLINSLLLQFWVFLSHFTCAAVIRSFTKCSVQPSSLTFLEFLEEFSNVKCEELLCDRVESDWLVRKVMACHDGWGNVEM